MIVVHLMGGLGNQLFQYTAARALADHHRVPLGFFFDDPYKLAKRQFELHQFNVTGKPLNPSDIKQYLPLRKVKRRLYKLLNLNYEGLMYREKNEFNFEPGFFNLPDTVLLYGFWQSYKYAQIIEEILRNELTLKETTEAYKKSERTLQTIPNSVSIHIRRSDYLNSKSGFTSLSIQYYIKAIAHITVKLGSIYPVIFTDDPAWVKQQFGFFKNPLYAADLKLSDYEELTLMSKCRHNIIANSSFSWWAAWLNRNPDKIIIAPEHWHTSVTANSTILLDSWTKIHDK